MTHVRHQTLRNVFSNWGGELVVVASGFILPRLIDTRMSQEELGIWDYGWSIRSYIALATSNLGSAAGFYVARYQSSGKWSSLNRTMGAMLAMILYGAAGAALVTLLVAFSTASLISTDSASLVLSAQVLTLAMGLSACVATPSMVCGGALVGCSRFDLLNLVDGICDVLMVSGLFACVALGGGLELMGCCVLAREALNGIGKYFFARRLVPELQFHPRWTDWSMFREIFGFSAKTLTDSLAKVLQYQAGVSVIAYVLGPAAVALYARPRALILISTRFVMGFTRVLVPAASALGERQDHERLGQLLIRSTKGAVYLALIPGLVLLILGDQVMQVWMGSKYAGTTVLTVLVIGYLPLLAQQATYHVLLGLASHGLAGIASLIGSVVGAVLAVVLVGYLHWGIVGAAIATAAPVLIVNLVVLPYAGCRAVGISLPKYALEALLLPALTMLPFAGVLMAARFVPVAPLRQLLIALVAGVPVLLAICWPSLLPAELRSRIGQRLRLFGKGRVIVKSDIIT